MHVQFMKINVWLLKISEDERIELGGGGGDEDGREMERWCDEAEGFYYFFI